MIQRRPLLIAFLATASSRAWAAASPRDIVVAVYRGVGGSSASWDAMFAKVMGRKRPFSKSFDAILKAADAKSRASQDAWLDFDPISNSQDPSIHGLSVNIVTDSATAATISAEFRYSDDPKSKLSQVIYDFVREGGVWALDDIRGGLQDGKDPGWSLRKLAQTAAAPHKP